jgi:4-hydroxybenzoate polyprenyltransferase
MKKIVQYRLHVYLQLFLLTLMSFPRITSRELTISLAVCMIGGWIFLFNKTTDLVEDNLNDGSLPVDQEYLGVIKRIAYICLIIPVLLLWRIPEVLAVVLFFGGFMGFIYSYPIRLKGRSFRLKNILLVKNLTSAVCITALICLPCYLLFPDFPHIYLLLKAISIFFLTLCVEIMCDIRDIEGDRQAGIMTLPNTLGVAPAKAIALVIFTGYCLWFNHLVSFSFRLSPLLILAQAATFLIILFTTAKRPYWYFHLITFAWSAFCLVSLAIWYA